MTNLTVICGAVDAVERARLAMVEAANRARHAKRAVELALASTLADPHDAELVARFQGAVVALQTAEREAAAAEWAHDKAVQDHRRIRELEHAETVAGLRRRRW